MPAPLAGLQDKERSAEAGGRLLGLTEEALVEWRVARFARGLVVPREGRELAPLGSMAVWRLLSCKETACAAAADRAARARLSRSLIG